MSSATQTPASAGSKPYNYPPGLDHNLIWYAFRKFRPADPIALFSHLAEKYGDIAHYRLGPEHIVFVNTPEYVREVLVVQNENFIKERTQQRTKLVLGEGLITADGAAHRAQRRAAQPAFHRQKVVAYAETMTEHTARMLELWHHGEIRDISTEMMELTLGIVAATLFGCELGSEVKELNKAVNEIMRDYQFLIALPLAELLLNFPIPQLRRFRKARSRLDRFVYRLIEEHGTGAAGRQSDLLSMLMERRGEHFPSDQQLRDEVLTILLAGFCCRRIWRPSGGCIRCWRDVRRRWAMSRDCGTQKWLWRRQCACIHRPGPWDAAPWPTFRSGRGDFRRARPCL
jgi:cytochrome P450